MTLTDIDNATSLTMDIIIQGAFEELGIEKKVDLVDKLRHHIEKILTHNKRLLRRFKSKRGNYIASEWVVHWLKGIVYKG